MGSSEKDIANLIFKMKGMEVLDRESMALVPAGTFSRSLWHAAALSSELNRLLAIQQQIYKQYKEEMAASGGICRANANTELPGTSEGKGETQSTSLVPVQRNWSNIRRRRFLKNDFNSYPEERFRWRMKRSYPLDHDTADEFQEDFRGHRPQKRRYHVTLGQYDNVLRGEDTFCCRINGKPIYEDRRFKSSEIQVYLLDLINEDHTRKIAEIRKAATSHDHEVDGKILEAEQFLYACKSELIIAFAITQGLRQNEIRSTAGELISDKVLPDILRKAGISFGSEVTPEKPVDISSTSTTDDAIYGTTVQEFPDESN